MVFPTSPPNSAALLSPTEVSVNSSQYEGGDCPVTYGPYFFQPLEKWAYYGVLWHHSPAGIVTSCIIPLQKWENQWENVCCSLHRTQLPDSFMLCSRLTIGWYWTTMPCYYIQDVLSPFLKATIPLFTFLISGAPSIVHWRDNVLLCTLHYCDNIHRVHMLDRHSCYIATMLQQEKERAEARPSRLPETAAHSDQWTTRLTREEARFVQRRSHVHMVSIRWYSCHKRETCTCQLSMSIQSWNNYSREWETEGREQTNRLNWSFQQHSYRSRYWNTGTVFDYLSPHVTQERRPSVMREREELQAANNSLC